MAYRDYPQPASETLPTMYDLPSEDPEGLGLGVWPGQYQDTQGI